MNDQKSVLTTGQAAKICKVSPRTVSKWLDNGLLQGYRIPGSDHRRVPVGELVGFMKKHGIPLAGMDDQVEAKPTNLTSALIDLN